MNFFKIILLLVLTSLPSLTQVAVINGPQNATIFMGDQALFFCITSGGLANDWLVNGTSLEQLHNQDFEHSHSVMSGITILNLTFPAKSEYNQTTIQCQVINSLRGEMKQSNTSTLLIQGLLSAVSDMKAARNNTAISVHWSAPFSLSVSGVNHDIWYCVLIHNKTEGINVSTLNSSDCDVFTTETYFIYYSEYGFSPCDDIFVTVIPFNGAGQGEASPNILTNTTSLTNVELVMGNITAISQFSCSVTVRLVSFENVCKPVLREAHGAFPEITLDESIVNFTLPADNIFLAYLEADRDSEMFKLTHQNIISTYDVQNIIIEKAMSSINMRIEFITNSTARGCFLMFESPTLPVVFRAIVRTDTSTTLTYPIVDLPPAEYSVLAYDLEYNLSPNQESALELDKPLVVTNQQTTKFSSCFIKKASLHFGGSYVIAECELMNIEGASCIMIGVKANDRSLIVSYFTSRISLRMEMTGNYTFAVFGRNTTYIDQQPTAMMVTDTTIDEIETTLTTTPNTEATDEEKNRERIKHNMLATTIVGAVVVTLTLVCITVVIVFIVCRHRSKVKHRTRRDPVAAKNVVYDEVILPSITPSSKFQNVQNNAYQLFKPSTLETFENVAYGFSHS